MAATEPEHPRAVALLSGGLDSSTLVYWLAEEGYAVHAISVDYNQRHASRELTAATDVAVALIERYPDRDMQHNIVGLGPVAASLLEGSALTSADVAVPHGHYTDQSMRATVVPNRNAILLALAYGAAVSRHAAVVAAAMHAGDHPIYPDCRPEFIRAFDTMEQLATEGYAEPQIALLTPFLTMSKADIVRTGHILRVPFNLTWSCYEGGDVHCGQCGTCVERAEAFREAGTDDPTRYWTVGFAAAP
jgi:7-cyano-7-deazaguanine synthase